MRHVTLSRETGAPAMHVVDFLTRPETLPLWAFHYCRSVASDGQGHIIETTQGDKLRYAPRAFPESGVVDLLSGADEKSMQALPLRVHALGPQRSLVVATMIMPPELPQATFDGLVACLDEELDRLAEVVVGEHAQPV